MTKEDIIKKENIVKKLACAENSVIDLIDKSEATIDGEIDDILNFNESYISITKQLDEIFKDLLAFDKTRENPLWDELDSINDDLNYIYDTSAIPINSVLAKKTLELQDVYKKSQGVQLAVFSIVLTILAFVLTNAKILAVDSIDFKNVLLVNLSFILSADVFFSFIYLFIGPIFYSKKSGLRIFTMIILPFLLITAIVLVAWLMK